ncbi:UNVERIFIED_CONTAM: hypothetical protein FKN15_031637 [Acipenser sinensis]
MLATKTMQHSSTSNGENLYYAWSSASNNIAGIKPFRARSIVLYTQHSDSHDATTTCYTHCIIN